MCKETSTDQSVRMSPAFPVKGVPFVAACLLLVVGSLLAGCLGGGEDFDPDGSENGMGSQSRTGTLRGTVGSIHFQVLEAQVNLWEDDRGSAPLAETVVGDNGTFQFSGLEPGVYAVQAQYPGYHSEIKRAQVEGGETTRVEFWLEPLPSDSPFEMDEEIRGLVHTVGYCARPAGDAGCGGAFIPFIPWENARGTLDLVDNETETVLVEMFWDSAGQLGEHLRLRVHCDEAEREADHPCFHEGEQMTSPIRIRIDKADAVEGGFAMAQEWRYEVLPGWGALGTYPVVGVDAGAAYEQAFTILVTYFQREAAPEGTSRVPG